MDMYANAPLASVDGLDNASDDCETSSSFGPSNSPPASVTNKLPHSNSILDDDDDSHYFNCSLGGSLTNLVLNFDEKIGYAATATTNDSPLELATNVREWSRPPKPRQALPGIEQVKWVSFGVTISHFLSRFWWREASEPGPINHYPLGQNPPNQLSDYYSEVFESADVDGLTEDEADDNEVQATPTRCVRFSESPCVLPSWSPNCPMSSCSGQSSPTTSCRSTTPPLDQNDLEGDDSLARFKELLPSLKNKKEALLEDLHRTTHSTASLRRLTADLERETQRHSDALVNQLALRDNLSMLREASDDCILLLRLLHQRRARASEEALRQTTARFGLRLPRFRLGGWFLFNNSPPPPTFNTTTHPVSSAISDLCLNATASNGHHGQSRPQNGTRPCEILLDLTSQSVSYRRGPAIKESSFGEQQSVNNDNGTLEHVEEAVTDTAASKSTQRARQRFDSLHQASLSQAWPRGGAQNSCALRLHVPLSKSSGRQLNLRRLRAINLVLYSALLESPATEHYLKAFLNQDLHRTTHSTASLRRLTADLERETQRHSDALVNQLALRDNLSMLREASDDCILLLRLLHQRRARASEEALRQTTARFGLRLPRFRLGGWFLFNNSPPPPTFNTTTHPVSSAISDLCLNATASNGHHGQSRPQNGTRPCEILLDLTSQSVSYRRGPAIKESSFGEQQSVNNDNGTLEHVEEAVTDTAASKSTQRARQRFDSLHQASLSQAWPRGGAQNSCALRLHVPLSKSSGRQLNLRRLRAINLVLYSALLESPATEHYLKAFLNQESDQISSPERPINSSSPPIAIYSNGTR